MMPTLHELLVAVKARVNSDEMLNNGLYRTMGICWHADQIFDKSGDYERRDVYLHELERDRLSAELRHLFAGWEHFSGDSTFPVPVPSEAEHAFRDPESIFQLTEDVWDTATEYGRLRRELLDYLIERTKP